LEIWCFGGGEEIEGEESVGLVLADGVGGVEDAGREIWHFKGCINGYVSEEAEVRVEITFFWCGVNIFAWRRCGLKG
jgi:hypothetical protein